MTSNLYGELRAAAPPLETPTRVLAIGAHPDDIEFGCGGTLARWAAAGCDVTMCIVTDGSKGTWDPTVDPKELAAQRGREQDAAAEVIGASRVVDLGYVDGELEYSMELRRQICELIRTHRPEVLFSHDPWKRYQLHPDHRATGFGAVDGMVAARDPLFFPDQGLDPQRPKAMLLWAADENDHWEDIASSLDVKIAALLCHHSQGETTMGDAHADDEARNAFASRVRQRAGATGAAAGLEFAEAFKRLNP